MDRRTAKWGMFGILAATVAFAGTAWAKPRAAANSTQLAKSSRPAPDSEPIEWAADLKAAHRLSVETGRPMLIVFGAPWCTYCKKLEAEVLGHPTLSKYINGAFVPVHLDVKKDERAAKVLDVKSLPTSVILTPEADLIGSIEGYVDVRKFAGVLKESLEFQRTLSEERMVAAKKPR